MLQNISSYLAENLFRTAPKYQLISGRKFVWNWSKISAHIWPKMCLGLAQNISSYLAENLFRTAPKYQLISGRKCVSNCGKISAHVWRKMCLRLELLQNISSYLVEICLELPQNIISYLAENVFRTGPKYQLISGRKCV